jgi:Tfp pilus assembly protein PilF
MVLRSLTVLGLLLVLGCSSGVSSENQRKSDYHFKLGKGYFFDQNIPMALRELDMSLVMNPHNERTHFLLAFIAMGRKNYTEAVLHYKKALEAKPDYFDARENLGAAYLAMRRWVEAIATLTPLLTERLYSTPYILHNNLGLAHMGKRDLASAVEEFKKSVFLNPRFCLGLNNLGRVYVEQGDERQAVKSFQKTIERCSEYGYADPFFYLGRIYERAGRRAEALELFRQCAELGGEAAIGDRCSQRLQGGL